MYPITAKIMTRAVIPIVLQLNDAAEFLTPEKNPDAAPPVVVDNDGTPLKRTLLLMGYLYILNKNKFVFKRNKESTRIIQYRR